MSTTPTELFETTAAAIAQATEPTEAGLDFNAIKEAMDGFDPGAMLPEMTALFGGLTTVCRIAVVIGPVIILILGLCYLFLAPKEANHYFGYRTYFGMGSINAWQYTQRLAGLVFTALGLGLTVVMVLISASFGGMEIMNMVWRAVSCLIWQAVLAVLATVFVNLSAALRFDRKGAFRRKRR